MHHNMKRIVTAALAVIVAGFLSISADAQNKKEKQTAQIEEVTFVTTVDCSNCQKKVEAKIPYEKGVKDLKVTLDDQTVWIKYDSSKTDKEKLAEALRKLGYEAEEKTE